MSGAPRYTIPVYYDFASILCHVAHRTLERMAETIDGYRIDLEWRPLDLTAITGWRRDAPVEGVRRENALRVAAELNVELVMPTRWLDSRRAHALALKLRGTPKEAAWRERVWSAVYEEGRALDGPGELEAMAGDLDLDIRPLVRRRDLERAEVETLLAQESGITGVPTFLLDEWPIGGIQEERTMRVLFSRFVRKKDRDAGIPLG